MVPGIQQTLHDWKTELYFYPLCPEHGSTGHVHSVDQFVHVGHQVFLTCLTRSIPASFYLTRMSKQGLRWRWLGCRGTPRRNIAPSGPPHPTPLTLCGMRSLLSLRRCVSVHQSCSNMHISTDKSECVCVSSWPAVLLLLVLICLLLLSLIDSAPRNGLFENCSPWRKR